MQNESYQQWPTNEIEFAKVDPLTDYDRLVLPPYSRGDIYKDLDATPIGFEIRILKIHVDDGDGDGDDDNINCSLETVTLATAPPFHALSYCWGDRSEMKTILINGIQVEIRNNLWEALLHLAAQKILSVWVDAISINQANLSERAHQVARMKSIYQKAVATVAWLGPCEEDYAESCRLLSRLSKRLRQTDPASNLSSDTIDFITESGVEIDKAPVPLTVLFDECLREVRKLDLEDDDTWPDPSQDEDSDTEHGPEISDNLREAIEGFFDAFGEFITDLLNRPYWTRVWMLQEITVGRKVILFCGDNTLTWDDLKFVAELTPSFFEYEFWNRSEDDASAQNLMTMEMLRSRVRDHVPVSFVECLYYSFNFESTVEQDRIFALLGLCWDADYFVPIITYEQGLQDLYADMAIHFIERCSLDIICLKGASNESEPSWIPHWLKVGEHSKFDERVVRYLAGGDKTMPARHREPMWHASGGSSASDAGVEKDSRTLKVFGKRIAVIEGLSVAGRSGKGPSGRHEYAQTSASSWSTRSDYDEVFTAVYWTLNLYKESEGLGDLGKRIDFMWSDEMFRKIKAEEEEDEDEDEDDEGKEGSEDESGDEDERADHGAESEDDVQNTADGDKEGMVDWLKELATFHVGTASLSWWIRTSNNTLSLSNTRRSNARQGGEMGVANEHEDQVYRAFRRVFREGRRLMTTTNGKVGWAHPRARPGDFIYLLAGCSLPVILRQRKDSHKGKKTFQVIGDAYVHDLMHGQLWKGRPAPVEMYLR